MAEKTGYTYYADPQRHLGNQVAVVIDNRHFSRMFMIQLLRSFCLKQEVFIHKVFHK